MVLRNRAQQIPDQPEDVSVVLGNEETAAIEWNPTLRSQSYRVRARVVGVDTEPVLIGSPKDPDFTMETLPLDADMEVWISGVGRGGEGRPHAL